MKKLLSTTALVFTLVFSGMVYAEGDWHHEGHDGHHAFMDVLPKEKAAQFHEVMQQAHAKNMVLLDQKHKLKEELHDILTAPKFDKEAFLAKSEELSKFRESMHTKIRANMKEAFATAVGQLSQEERQALAASMEQMQHGHEAPQHPHGDWEHGHEHSQQHEMEKHKGYKPVPTHDSDQ